MVYIDWTFSEVLAWYMFMYIPQLAHSGSRLDKLTKPNCHEAPPWLPQSGKFWTFGVSKLSQMAFSNSFLPLFLAPFIMICESMLYPWVRMDYYDKCWQYQNIHYRYFDYIYIYIYIWFQIYYPPPPYKTLGLGGPFPPAFYAPCSH